jgi:hypothetical protein
MERYLTGWGGCSLGCAVVVLRFVVLYCLVLFSASSYFFRDDFSTG